MFTSEAQKIPSSWSPDGRFLALLQSRWCRLTCGCFHSREARQIESLSPLNSRSSCRRWAGFLRTAGGSLTNRMNRGRMKSMCGRSVLLPLRDLRPRRARQSQANGWYRRTAGESLSGDMMARNSFISRRTEWRWPLTSIRQAYFRREFRSPSSRCTPGLLYWDVTSDGKRFLMPAPSASDASAPFTVVLNWQAALKK